MGGTNSRPCYLVSRPLGTDGAAAGPGGLRWRAIGKGQRHEVPRLDKKCQETPQLNEAWTLQSPFTQHWALCILPDGKDVNPTSKNARSAFLNADYVDLGAQSTQQALTALRGIPASASHVSFSRSTTKWKEKEVADIAALVKVGTTKASMQKVLKKARGLIVNWGTYRPIIWNCQHFALFIAQIILEPSDKYCKMANKILAAREKWVTMLRGLKNGTGVTAGAASLIIPAIGQFLALALAGITVGTSILDGMQRREVEAKWEEFLNEHRALQKLAFI